MLIQVLYGYDRMHACGEQRCAPFHATTRLKSFLETSSINYVRKLTVTQLNPIKDL
jgi:hypothetical protein